jgi:hypothetical protein
MYFVNKVLSRTCVFGAIAALSACGGGGGGDSTATTTSTTSSTEVSGTASKGLLQNALVTAYCGVKSTANAIGTTSTDTNGAYTLKLTQACTLPVEIVVTAKATGTTMLDEIAGVIPAPANLSMRAFVPSATGTVTLPVTPFTDMAAAIVENSIGSTNALSSAVVNNANLAIITNVLGGNAGLFTAKPLPPTAYSDASTSADQQQLIVMLTAISQAAQSAAGATAGDKVQTVLTQLANQAKQTVPAVSATGYTVSLSADTTATTGANATPLATISGGLTALAASNNTTNLGAAANAIQGGVANVQTAVVTTSTSKISTTQTAGGTVTPPPSAVQTGIAAARTLFTAVKTNVLALVTTDPLNPGFLQTQATNLNNDINSQALAGTYHVTDILVAAHRATTLLAQTNKAVAAVASGGANVAPAGTAAKTNAFGNFYQRITTEGAGQMTCNGYYTQGAGLTANDASVRVSPLANNSGNPVANCGMLIYSGDRQREMQFVVRSPASKPTTGTNTFVYVNRIRTWADPTCNSGANPACLFVDSNEVTGQLTATLDANLAVTSMKIVDQPVIPLQGNTASTLALDYTASQVGNVTTIAMTAGQSSGTLKYNFGSGSQLVVTDNSTSTPASTSVVAKLVGKVQTANFELSGTFNLSGTNANNTTSNGTVGFTGSISTLSGGVATPFLDGTVTGNSAASTVAFSGKVTNGSAVNSISITGDSSVLGQQKGTVTVLTPGYSFTASGTSYDNVTVPSTMTVTASDGTKIFVQRVNGTSTIDVQNSAGTKIGSLAGNQINFEDGSFIVLN